MKRKNIAAVAATLALFTFGTLLTGCGSKKVEAKKELVVWSHLTESEVKEIQKVADEWGTANNTKVKVQVDTSDFQAFLQAANSSKAADILFGMPHNDLGTFQKAGLLDEVPSSVLDKSKYPEVAVKAVTWDGKQYGMPLALETTTLFVNKDKVKEIPATYEDLIKQGKTLGFQYDIKNLYFSYGLVATNGGYIFKDDNGTLDSSNIGLDNDGAKKAYKMIQDMVVTDKLMPADITGDIAKGNFQAGKSAFYISGPWDVDAFKKANANFEVVTMPKIDGKNVSNFVGVQSAVVNAKSKNKDAAWGLMKYLVEKTPQVLNEKGNRIPALLSEQQKDYFKSNKTAAVFAEQAKYGIPMPNISEMNSVWGPCGDNFALLTQGKTTPEDAAKLIAEQVKKGIASSK